MSRIVQFFSDESGPTAVEYAIMLVMILVAVIGSVALFGMATNNSIATTRTAMETAVNE